MHREAWSAAIHGVTKSQTQLSDWTELNWIFLICTWRASLIAQLVRNPPSMQETPVWYPGLGRSARLPTPVFLGFPWGSAGKESACNAGDLGSTTGLRRSPGEGKGYPLQYSGLENSMNCIVHGGHKELDTAEQLSLSHMYMKHFVYSLICWWTLGLFPRFGYLWIMLLWNGCANITFRFCLQFFWLYTQKWNYCVIWWLYF